MSATKPQLNSQLARPLLLLEAEQQTRVMNLMNMEAMTVMTSTTRSHLVPPSVINSTVSSATAASQAQIHSHMVEDQRKVSTRSQASPLNLPLSTELIRSELDLAMQASLVTIALISMEVLLVVPTQRARTLINMTLQESVTVQQSTLVSEHSVLRKTLLASLLWVTTTLTKMARSMAVRLPLGRLEI